MTKYLSFPDDGINKVAVAIELVLDHVVEGFQQEEHQMMVVGLVQEEPGG